jgi:hypothetical protein
MYIILDLLRHVLPLKFGSATYCDPKVPSIGSSLVVGFKTNGRKIGLYITYDSYIGYHFHYCCPLARTLHWIRVCCLVL